MENIGLFIKNRRTNLNISLRELARQTDITPSWITKVEQGVIANPGKEHIQKIFDVLEVEPNWLVKFGYVEGELDNIFIEKELSRSNQKQALRDNITNELEKLDKDTLEAVNTMLFKHRDLLMNIYKLDSSVKPMPVTVMKEMSKFYLSEYASKI